MSEYNSSYPPPPPTSGPPPLPSAFGNSGDPLRRGPGSDKPRGKPLSFWVALILFFVLGLSVLINLSLLMTLVGASAETSSAESPYKEKRVEGSGNAKIALIKVKGVIMDRESEGLFGSGQSIVERTVAQLRQASADAEVKAVVLEVDSPGGGVTASDEIYNEVKKVRDGGKPLVVHMGDLCASGGYYISAPASSIVASPTSITGSIGVIASFLNAQGLLEQKLGLQGQIIKSGPHKDMASPWRPMTVEERAIFQTLIDEMYERFLGIVVQGRTGHGPFTGDPKVAAATIRQLADGRVYTGEQAVKNGLADKVGYLADAIAEARRLAGVTDATVIRYTRNMGLLEVLSGAEGRVNMNAGVQIDAASITQELVPKIEYRWAP